MMLVMRGATRVCILGNIGNLCIFPSVFSMKLKLLEFLFKDSTEAKGNDSFISSSQLRDI